MNQVHEGVRGLEQQPAKNVTHSKKKKKPTTGTSYAEIIQHRLLNNEVYYVPKHKV